ncbi:hypothetical protein Drorol1_Dr00013649 [Drosera rotundifolia]
MGSNFNYRGFGIESSMDGGGGPGGGRPPPGDFPLSRQASIYSLTFDEFQSTIGGSGKDFGSMNMDELLKNIWSAEETQNMAAAAGASAHQEVGNYNHGGYLQRQGSLTLPRTLSQKTVDEVWRDLSKEFGGGNEGGVGGSVTQRQQTLGEITLEEFLSRAGVVREDNPLPSKPNEGGFFGDLSQPSSNNAGFGINFQQSSRGLGLMGTRIESTNPISLQTSSLAMNANGGMRSSQPQRTPPRLPLQQPQPPQQQQPIFPKQNAVSYATQIAMQPGAQLGGTGLRGGVVGFDGMAPGATLQGGGLGLAALGGGAIRVSTGSPAALSSDGAARSSGDTASVSPVPYLFNGGLRGRKYNNAVEKVIERRQRRMIKNRESAARSRARKQAYTMELEQEVTKLKEENQELRKKQAEIMELQKKQEMEMRNLQQAQKRRCLRRTQTGPW